MGGVPSVSPSNARSLLARERNPEAIDFANRLMTGAISRRSIFMTGVGVEANLLPRLETAPMSIAKRFLKP